MIARQGQLFVFVACVIVVLNEYLPEASSLILLIAIALLGVPHGAIDTIYAQRQFRVQGVRQWALFGVAYLVPVVLVVGLWRVEPCWFLIGFLVVSTIHFSGDPEAGVPLWVRLLYGGAVIVLPALKHSRELTLLFGSLVPLADAKWISAGLSAASLPWALAMGVAAIRVGRKYRWSAAEIAAVGLLSTVASPLVSFTVFFCGMHSARHILRSIEYSGDIEIRSLLVSASLPLIGTFGALGIGFTFLRGTPLDDQLMQLIFVALAALTVPHMALVERVRFAGWPQETRGH